MYWAYTPMHVSSGSSGGLYGMLQLFSLSAPLFHYRDGMPLTANVLPVDLPTPDRAMWLRCSQIQYIQFAHWCCQHCCQGRPPFRHYSDAGQMKKLSIRDIHSSPPDTPIRHQNHGCCPVTYAHLYVPMPN